MSIDREEIVAKLETIVKTYFRTCVTCQHFDEQKEICNLANQRPPAKIIAYGCPSHLEIPF